MPIYEYVCRECGEQLEKLQKLSDNSLTDCPACGQSALKRKVSAAGFRLSGGGWYETDFKSDGRRHLAGENDKSDNSEKSDKSTAGEGDNKSADKAQGKNANSASESGSKNSATQSDKPAAKSGDSTKKSASGKSAD